MKKIVTLLKIVIFYILAVYCYQYFFLKLVIWPSIKFAIHNLPAYRNNIHDFIQLDYGRMVGRIAEFIWVATLFIFYSKYIDKLSLQNTAIFPKSSIAKYFSYGALLGFLIVGVMIVLISLTHAITLTRSTQALSMLIPVAILYLFAMLMTAFSEELIIRGYVLSNLFKIINPHTAIFLTAIIFGGWHFQHSLLYAIQAFLFGLLAGYGFFLTRNLYFCIGLHFGWNFIESIVYSHPLFHITVNNAFLAGTKNITPDCEGILALPALLAGFIILLMFYKFEKGN